jgi:hypothetical protein
VDITRNDTTNARRHLAPHDVGEGRAAWE